MALLDSILGHLGLDALLQYVLKRFPVLDKLFNLGKRIVEHFTGTVGAGVHLFDSFQSEITAWRNFREDFRIRQRVVNVERAISKSKELITGLVESWRSIVQIIRSLTTKLEVSGAAEIVEAASGIGLPVALVNAIVTIVEVLDTVRNVIDAFQTIIDEITRIRTFVETGDTIFLGQHNKRRTVTTLDGEKLRLRVGSLHS